MRAGEIAQLLTTDFDFHGEIPLIKVHDDGDADGRAKKLKTESSIRDIPISSVLITLGLREFVEGRHRRWRGGRLFREVPLGAKDRRSDGLTKFWGRALRDAGLHKRGRSTHVFRHTVTQAMRAAAVREEIIGAVLGHSPSTITGRYGGRFPLALVAEAVDSIEYGFDVVAELGGEYDPAVHREG